MNRTKGKQPVTGASLTVSLPELMAKLNCGRHTAEKIALAAGAKIKIGRKALYHVGKIEQYLEEQAGDLEE